MWVPGAHWGEGISYSWRLPDQRTAAGLTGLSPWGPVRLRGHFRGCLQFTPVATGEVGFHRSTLLLCLENTLMDILLGDLFSLGGKEYDKGKWLGQYSRERGIRVFSGGPKGGRDLGKKNGLGKTKVSSVCLSSLGDSIQLDATFISNLFTVTCGALELFICA